MPEKEMLDESALSNFLTDDSEMPEFVENRVGANLPPVSQDPPFVDNAESVETKEVQKPITETPKKEEFVKVDETSSNREEDNVESETVALQVFNTLQSSLGIEFTDEELSAIPLSDGVDAISELTALSINKKSNQLFENFFEENPDIYEAVQYKRANGSLTGFGEKSSEFTDYSSLDLSSESTQENLYRKSLELKGLDKGSIDDLVEIAKDKFNLEDKAKLAKTELETLEKSKKEEYENSLKAKIEAEEQERLQIVQEVTKTINEGKILGVTLDSKTKAQFKDYFSKPVDGTGKTAKEIADSSLTLEQELYLEYLKMTGFKSLANDGAKKIRSLADVIREGQKNRASVQFEKGNASNTNVSASRILDNESLERFLSE